MMRPLRIALLISVLGAAQAHAGMFDDEEARRQIKDLTIKSEARFDQQGKAQLDLANQLQRQSEEIARLRGQVHHTVEALARKQGRHGSPISHVHLVKGESARRADGIQPRLLERDVVIIVQIVDAHHLIAARQQFHGHRHADEAGAACYEYLHAMQRDWNVWM